MLAFLLREIKGYCLLVAMKANTGSIKVDFTQRVTAKLDQWSTEAAIAAARANMQGKSARLVVYPTGLKMMRFADPFCEFGMHYEVPPRVWESLRGKVAL